jgi:hypothetical protein
MKCYVIKKLSDEASQVTEDHKFTNFVQYNLIMKNNKYFNFRYISWRNNKVKEKENIPNTYTTKIYLDNTNAIVIIK